MITVHHLNNSRSQRILWLLEELGLEYQLQTYQRDPKTMLAPASLKKIHPLGKSPVLTDGDNTVAESGAIIEYLIQAYATDAFKLDPDSQAYRDYIYWLHYGEGSLMPQLLLKLVCDKMKTGPMPFFIKPVAKMISNKIMETLVNPNLEAAFAFIENTLADREWFAGDSISGADIQMSFPLEASVARGLIDGRYPHIQAFVEKVHKRPAYQKTLSLGGTYDYA